MNAILALIYSLLDIYKFLIVVYVIFSWLIAFRIINTHNYFIQVVSNFLARIITPLTNRISRYIPPLGGVDLSPLLLLLLVYFIQRLMVDNFGYQITYL